MRNSRHDYGDSSPVCLKHNERKKSFTLGSGTHCLGQTLINRLPPPGNLLKTTADCYPFNEAVRYIWLLKVVVPLYCMTTYALHMHCQHITVITRSIFKQSCNPPYSDDETS